MNIPGHKTVLWLIAMFSVAMLPQMLRMQLSLIHISEPTRPSP